jgi:hypothetical protein
MQAKTTPEPSIRPGVQVPISEGRTPSHCFSWRAFRSRKYPAMNGGQSWRDCGMLLGQVISPEIEDRASFYFEKIS